jgi:exonuclease III
MSDANKKEKANEQEKSIPLKKFDYYDDLEERFLQHAREFRFKLAKRLAQANTMLNVDDVMTTMQYILTDYTGSEFKTFNSVFRKSDFTVNDVRKTPGLLWKILVLLWLTQNDRLPFDLEVYRFLTDTAAINILTSDIKDVKNFELAQLQQQKYVLQSAIWESMIAKYIGSDLMKELEISVDTAKEILQAWSQSKYNKFDSPAFRNATLKLATGHLPRLIREICSSKNEKDPDAWLLQKRAEIQLDFKAFLTFEEAKTIFTQKFVNPNTPAAKQYWETQVLPWSIPDLAKEKQTQMTRYEEFSSKLKEKGTVLVQPSFTSTTLKPTRFPSKPNHGVFRTYVMVFQLKKGFPCHYIKGLSEYELLLAPCSSWKVSRVEGHKIYLTLEKLPDLPYQPTFTELVDIFTRCHRNMIQFSKEDPKVKEDADAQDLKLSQVIYPKLICRHYYKTREAPIVSQISELYSTDKKSLQPTLIDKLVTQSYANVKSGNRKELELAFKNFVVLAFQHKASLGWPSFKVAAPTHRLISINCHGFADEKKSTITEYFVQHFLPDYICFQEHTSFEEKQEKQEKEKPEMPKCVTSEGLANLTMIREPSTYTYESVYLDETKERCMTMITFTQPNFVLVNCHLRVANPISDRLQEAKIMCDVLAKKTQGKSVMIVGDFNAIDYHDYTVEQAAWMKNQASQAHPQDFETMDYFASRGYQDAFHMLGKRCPISVWSGKRVDFILVAKRPPSLKILHVTMLPLLFSDHLPLLVDFSIG